VKTTPFGAVWDYLCAKADALLDCAWMDEVKKYESKILRHRRQAIGCL
jgi:L-rhamnose isomerase